MIHVKYNGVNNMAWRKIMLSPLIKRRIFQVAKDLNKQVPNNYQQILGKIQENCISEEKIIFSWLYGSGSMTLNANATIPHCVICTAGWAVRLVFYQDEKTFNAFRITLGHELTHKEGDFFSFCYKRRDYKLMYQSREVHADFGAAEKMTNCSRKKLLDSIRYKKALKETDKGDFFHPSWERREYYAEHFNFDEELIRQIAIDVGCSNEKLIKKISEYYKKIILRS